MTGTDHQPLSDAPVTSRIRDHAPNRLGAVYSALYCFWTARHAAAISTQEKLGARFSFYSTLHTFFSGQPATTVVDQQTTDTRRDAYSVVLFNHRTKNALVNDLTSSPDQLLGALLGERAEGGTNFSSALRAGEAIMTENWNPERRVIKNPVLSVRLLSDPLKSRIPVMIFLSDGECSLPLEEIRDVCRSAVRHGWVAFCLHKQIIDCLCRKALSFHAVSFGQESLNHTLHQMAEAALEIQNDAFQRPMRPTLPSSFTPALDTVSILIPSIASKLQILMLSRCGLPRHS